MVRAFKSAYQSYATYLDDGNKKIQTKDEGKAKQITSDMILNKNKQYMKLAEKKCDSVFVVKGNWLKRKCDQVKEEFKTIEQDILALKDNKKRFL